MIDAGDLDRSGQLIDQAYNLAAGEFGEQSELYAGVLATRDRLLLYLRRLHESRRDLERSALFFRGNPELPAGHLPAILLHLAYITNTEGKEADPIVHEAYEIDHKTYGDDHPENLKDAEVIRLIKTTKGWAYRTFMEGTIEDHKQREVAGRQQIRRFPAKPR